MAKERMVTRKVIESKKYNVYKIDGTQLVLLDTIEDKGKLSEREIAKKYNVDKVVLDCIEEKKVTYGVPVSKFMEIAEKIADDTNEVVNEVESLSAVETENK